MGVSWKRLLRREEIDMSETFNRLAQSLKSHSGLTITKVLHIWSGWSTKRT